MTPVRRAVIFRNEFDAWPDDARVIFLSVKISELYCDLRTCPNTRDRRCHWRFLGLFASAQDAESGTAHPSLIKLAEEGFSYEIRSGHCGSYQISADRTRSFSRRICKAAGLQKHCKRNPPDRRHVRGQHRRNETVDGRAAASLGDIC